MQRSSFGQQKGKTMTRILSALAAVMLLGFGLPAAAQDKSKGTAAEATGTPMRRMARANISLAEAEPEPLTLANLTTKSLTALIADMRTPSWAH